MGFIPIGSGGSAAFVDLRLCPKSIIDKSCPNSTMSIFHSSGYAGGAAQIPQANTINDKSPTNIHDSSGYAGGAAQIPQANAINDKSSPNSTTNIHDSSGYAGGAVQIPLLQVFNHKHPRFIRLCRRRCPNSTSSG